MSRPAAATRFPPRRNPDPLSTASSLLSLGLFAGGGLWLLAPEADGTSRAQKLLRGWRGLSGMLPGGGSGGGSSGSPSTPPANAGANQFDFGDASRVIGYSVPDRVEGAAVVVHRGPGGRFRIVVEVRDAGFIGLNPTPWQPVLDTTVDVGNDTDWTSYTVDIPNTAAYVPDLAARFSAQATIYGLGSEWYVTRELPKEFRMF